MALYGSKAIRGHGIPEAMEQILTNQSKIKPTITYLKPISSAIAIGTGGPFGAEGPIIATGGALGSTLGQLLKITHNVYIPDHVDPSFSFGWTHHSCHGDPPLVKGLFCHRF